jgi:hypothetical protein
VKTTWKPAAIGYCQVLLFAATVLIVLFFFHFLILLQEGRMRGQAFVTFPTVELAQRALVSDFVIDTMSCL